MPEGQIIVPRRRTARHDYRDIAAKSSYTVIFVVLALVAIRPLMVNQILGRADAYAAFGLRDDAERQCNKALLLNADNSQAWCQLARLYKGRGDRDMAYGAYQKATEADPLNVPAQFELGMMYAQDDGHQMAIPHFEQVRVIGPDDPATGLPKKGFPYHRASLDMLILCYEKVGDPTKAEFTLKELRVFYPHYVRAEASAPPPQDPSPE